MKEITQAFVLAAGLGKRLFLFVSSRRRHTIYIGDWSSDVCSSDLLGVGVERAFVGPVRKRGTLVTLVMTVGVLLLLTEGTVQFWGPDTPPIPSIFPDDSIKIGRASCRGRAKVALVTVIY